MFLFLSHIIVQKKVGQVLEAALIKERLRTQVMSVLLLHHRAMWSSFLQPDTSIPGNIHANWILAFQLERREKEDEGNQIRLFFKAIIQRLHASLTFIYSWSKLIICRTLSRSKRRLTMQFPTCIRRREKGGMDPEQLIVSVMGPS